MKFQATISFLLLISLAVLIDGVVVFCDFKNGSAYGYQCHVKYLQIKSKLDRTITDVAGDHLSGKSNDDVKFFNCVNHVVKYYPLNLTNTFKNLETVSIYNATLSEIHAEDLQQFGGKLKKFWNQYNVIEVLEADLFKFTPNVELVSFSSNKIKHVDDGVFRDLKKLSALYLGGNLCNYTANNRTSVLDLVPKIEGTCKDYAYMLEKHQAMMQIKFDEIHQKLFLMEINCRCAGESAIEIE